MINKPLIRKPIGIGSLADLNTQHIEGIAQMGNTPFSVSLYSQITDTLWTGGCPIETVPFEFQFVVCLYRPESYEHHRHQTYLEAQLNDTNDIPSIPILNALADYVNAVRKIGLTLVHCQAGLNRSALVAGLALIRGGMEPSTVIKLLREKRSAAVLCNPAFERFLLELK